MASFSYEKTNCIAIGGALRGLSRTILEASDQNLYIEYGREFRNALDSASAVAVFAFDELSKEKKNENQSRKTS